MGASDVTGQDLDRLIADWNDTAAAVPGTTLPDLFAEQVVRTPRAPAVVFEGEELTYAQLARRVGDLAAALRARGAGPGRIVAIAVPRSLELIAGLLAVLETGAAYLPIDPDYPADRIAFMLADAEPVLVLSTMAAGVVLPGGTEKILLDRIDLTAAHPNGHRHRRPTPHDAAYVIYTSGSTGRPKGVVVSHRGIVNRLLWMQAEYRLGADDRVLQKTPSSFDVSVWEFFWPLIVGATLVVARPDGHRDTAYLAETIQSAGITTIHFVPSMLQVFLTEPAAAACTGLRRVICSGEALPADLAQRFRDTVGVGLHNLYGPTEASVDVTYWECAEEPGQTSVPIGRPVWNTQVHVLDANLRPVPVGEIGELHLGGVQLADGYLRRSALTAQRFVASPYGPAGSRMYRTGDLARWREDGVLDYAGRVDHQVKIHGQRIELGEIEATLADDPAVAQVAVTLREDREGSHRLVAYVVPAAGDPAEFDVVRLRRHAADSLPAHMTPAAVVVLEAFPLSPSGKLDRAALPAPPKTAPEQGRAATTPVERALCELVGEALEVTGIGVDHDFFDLGGDSITAIRLVSAARRRGLAFTQRDVFAQRTVERLALVVSQAGTGALPQLSSVDNESTGGLPDGTVAWPLTPLQEGLLFHASLDSDAPDVYTMQLTFELHGEVDTAVLRASAEALLHRHPNLRAGFPHDRSDRPVQVIAEHVDLPWTEIDLTGTPEAERDAEADRLAEADAAVRFDLAAPPLLRFTLLRLGARRWRVLVAHHHILIDGWSTPTLVREWLSGEATAGASPYQHYLGWLAGLDRQAAERAWSETLDGIDEPTLVAAPGSSREPGETEHLVTALSAESTSALSAAARRHGFTMNTVVQAAWAMLVGQLTGRQDVVFGTTASVRPPELPGAGSMIGFFLNTTPVRVRLDPARSLANLLAAVQDQQSRMTEHQCLGLSDLHRLTGLDELFDTLTVFENFPAEPVSPSDAIRVGELNTTYPSSYPLSLYAIPGQSGAVGGGGLRLRLCFRPEVFDRADAEALGLRLLRVLEAFTEDAHQPVGRLRLLGEEDLALAVSGRNQTAHPLPGGDLVDLFEQAVAATPDNVAVLSPAESHTYAELNARANRLARVLLAEGAAPDRFVALVLPRTPDLVVALLAVLKTGAAYLPIDPDYPADRVRFMLDDADPALVVTTTELAGDLPGNVVALDDPATAARVRECSGADLTDTERGRLLPGSAAYVIYTSGSTGRPKGVVVPRSAFLNFLLCMRERFPLDGADRLLSVTTIAFDIAGLEVFVPLLSGAGVVIAPKDTVVDPESLAALIRGTGTTIMQATPSLWQSLVTTVPSSLAGLRVLVGGEALPASLAADMRELASQVTNLYGPTETTVWSTAAVLGQDGTPTIGGPIWNTQVYVLDAALRPVPAGVTGELYLGGDGLSRGYLGRPGLTAERFVASPYGGPAGTAAQSASVGGGGRATGGRMYRTGDLARWRADGNLDFLGRVDHQVKVRGFRIELGEVEATIAGHDDVARCAVVVREDRPGDKLIVAYVTGRAPDPAGLRALVAASLPEYMVPAAVVALDELPLTPNGKLDRAALPAPDLLAAGGPVASRGARTPREAILCELFAEVLGTPRIGVDDDFFRAGGHSLLAIRLVSRVRAVFKAELRIKTVFEAPTVGKLAGLIGGSSDARAPLTRYERPERVPLSFTQQRLWFLNRFEGPSPTYNVPLVLRLSGTVDVEALRAALDDVAGRHEAMRTVFVAGDGDPHQVVLDATPALTVSEVDERDLDAALLAAARTGFDLGADLPVRAHLMSTAPDRHVLLLVLHHIAVDGWSLSPLARDLATAYTARCAGRGPEWTPLPVQYVDYTLWQHEMLSDSSGGALDGQLDFWTKTLADGPDHLELPTDRPRPPELSNRGGTAAVHIGPELHGAMVALARKSGATVFMVLQAGLAALLTRLGAGTDIPIGTPVAGRTDDALDDLVGMFVNTLVLRTGTAGNPTFRELVERVREVDVAAFANADTPFERLVERLQPARSLSRHPLFQVMLVFQNALREKVELPGLAASVDTLDIGVAKFDLTVDLHERTGADGTRDGIEGKLEYSTDLFDRATAELFVERLVRLLTDAANDPATPIGELEVLSEPEKQRLLHDWMGPREDTPLAPLPTLVEARVRATPDAVAVRFDGAESTYAELNERANRLAHHLVRLGIGPEDVVALAFPRSTEMIVAWLAVLKAGAAYLPIDPGYPAERIEYMLVDAEPALALTVRAVADQLAGLGADVLAIDDQSTVDALTRCPASDVTDADRRHALSVDNAAYVIYTSGSTGKPKGVTVTHRGIGNVAATHVDRLGLDATSRFLLVVSISFDVSMADIAMTLLAGATLVVPPPEARAAGDDLAALIEGNAITHTDVVASMLASMPERDLPTLRGFVVGGEACTAELVRKWAPGRTMMQVYGPTETTVVATMSDPLGGPLDGDAPPIGRPIPNAVVRVLGADLRPVPPGVTGELYITGAGLARGYRHRRGLTAERFVADPYCASADTAARSGSVGGGGWVTGDTAARSASVGGGGRVTADTAARSASVGGGGWATGGRMYRTGDLVRWRADGNLEFVGRDDNQVKIRGFRIELGEVEAAVSGHDAVRQAVVIAREDQPGLKRLVAYVVPDGGAALDPVDLRAHAAAVLPEYMVPSAFVVLDAIALTANGKVDRRALPAPDLSGIVSGRAPRTAREQALATVFADVLGLPRVGIDDNFFDLGGHSLLAARLIGRVHAALGAEIGLRALFEAPTVAALADRLGTASGGDLDVLLPLRGTGTRTPLFCVHPAVGVGWVYSGLLRHLGQDRPVYALQASGLTDPAGSPATVEQMAGRYVAAIRTVAPHGPYLLLGWSFGGHVAHAMATRLQAEGERVDLLAVLDAYPATESGPAGEHEVLAAILESVGVSADEPLDPAAFLAALNQAGNPLAGVAETHLDAMASVFAGNADLASRFTPGRFAGDLVHFRATEGKSAADPVPADWHPFVTGAVDVVEVACAHGEMTQPEPIARIGGELAALIDARSDVTEGARP
ncbi:hypothetical protein GCM10009754_41020 [Amycolatopsis minnesotensis]|uniref:Carrier domain-containing protein n=1 Tax=Amycolatopsis minnesotensis TaxID=337894 RepID=A0ABP5CME3_9PSEU